MRRRKKEALGGRIWAALLTFGLTGQIAWVVENMYFNVFLYNTIVRDTGLIADMVAASAVVAAVSTLGAGAISDRMGRRKPIIVTGYLLWGLSVMAFAIVSVDGMSLLMGPARAIHSAAVMVIVLDCVMTLFGSCANDAAFNAWVTDVTDSGNRGRVEAVLATMPLVAMLLVFGMLDGLTAAGNWSAFFIIVGGLTMMAGLLGRFLLQDTDDFRPAGGGKILYGLRPHVVVGHPALYLSLLALAVYAASQQVYMPYLLIYIQQYLGVDNYALILGVVLAASSIASVAFGRVIDKQGKLQVAKPAAAAAGGGLIAMFLARGTVPVILAGTLMLGSSMVLSACLQGLIRDHTPADKAGQFQGIRVLFQVLLPMVTGPAIGSAVIGYTGRTYDELGVVKEVPTPEIFIASAMVLALVAIPLALLRIREPGYRLARRSLRPMLTPWGEALDRENPLPEYPRPQLRREKWMNLNGRWRYAIRHDGGAPDIYDGEIIVPFSPESLLSGVSRQVMPGDKLWYRRTFNLPPDFQDGRVLLHFGAVDQSCQVFVNGELAGEHEGGYLPFTCEITDSLTGGENTLTVAVTDSTSQSRHAYGKQSFRPGGIWYTPQSGIWQTVWLEPVPQNHIEDLVLTPDFDRRRVRWAIQADSPGGAAVEVRCGGEVIAEGRTEADGTGWAAIPDEHFRPWSPSDPFLYDVTVTLADGDRVESYFAMRSFGVTTIKKRRVLSLNGKPIFMSGVLDQGYWSDGLYTPPADEAMVYDIQTMKDCGFNMLRKHIKIEPLRWYYHCDRLGMIVWQDLVSGGSRLDPLVIQVLPFLNIHLRDSSYRRFGREAEASRDQYVQDLYDTVKLLRSTPSLAVWVPFNEGWGQFDSLQMAQLLRELDPTRLVDHASGWHDQGGGDFKSRHVYFRPVRLRRDKKRVLALTEFGGYSLPVAGHVSSEKKFGYRMYETEDELLEAVERLYLGEVAPCVKRQGLSAAVYTQLSDVEDEVNGILTYDRRVLKVEPSRLRAIHRELRF